MVWPNFRFGFIILAALVACCFLYAFDSTRHHVPLCLFHALTGWECPGCGMWRASHCLLHGDFASAWKYNPAWPAYAILAVLGWIHSKSKGTQGVPWKAVIFLLCILWIGGYGLIRNF